MANDDSTSTQSRVPRSDHIIAAIGLVLLLFLLFLKPQRTPAFLGVDASYVLKGQSPIQDIAQDIVGFRALLEQKDPYPVLGPAFREIGVLWNVDHASTHPPTSFLLAAPVAYLPWKWASAVWAWLMAALLFQSFRFYGLRWRVAFGLTTVALFWTPVATSLGQTTIIWLCGLAWAYSRLGRNPFWSGAGIAVASFAKFLPALLVVVFFFKRLWRGIAGMAIFWIAALVLLLIIARGSVSRYVEVNSTNSVITILRNDNASLLATGYRVAGWAGIACGLLFLILVILTNRECLSTGKDHMSMLRIWMLCSYLSVALLPISWNYSLVPLIPVLLFFLWKGGLDLILISIASIVISEFSTPWGKDSVAPLVTVTVLVGVGLILCGRPLKYPFTESFSNLFS